MSAYIVSGVDAECRQDILVATTSRRYARELCEGREATIEETSKLGLLESIGSLWLAATVRTPQAVQMFNARVGVGVPASRRRRRRES